MVRGRMALRLQGVRRCRLGEYHAELARHAGAQQAVLAWVEARLGTSRYRLRSPVHDPTALVPDEKLMEIAYFVGAFVLLVALIYGTLQHHYRNRAAARVGGEIARERYRRDET